MNGLEVGEILGLLLIKDYDETKKVKVIFEDQNCHYEAVSIKNIECVDKNVIITSEIRSREPMTIRELIFKLQRHQSSKKIVFEIYDDYACMISTNVPKFSDIKINEDESFIIFNIS